MVSIWWLVAIVVIFALLTVYLLVKIGELLSKLGSAEERIEKLLQDNDNLENRFYATRRLIFNSPIKVVPWEVKNV